mmetsp:Transcript_5971/g.10754  ORF Transcript_5971/g.10754 Transcript_5971/m.10754 type:complete len:229 (-) Transcript_5971:1145-1831(-)
MIGIIGGTVAITLAFVFLTFGMLVLFTPGSSVVTSLAGEKGMSKIHTIRKQVLSPYYSQFPHVFTEKELKSFDGSDPSKPVLLGVTGLVFDVTAGARHYSKSMKGGYSFFSGRDATFLFATAEEGEERKWCGSESLDDKEGIEESTRQSIEHWVKFYKTHEQYFQVGTVDLPPCQPKDLRAATEDNINLHTISPEVKQLGELEKEGRHDEALEIAAEPNALPEAHDEL